MWAFFFHSHGTVDLFPGQMKSRVGKYPAENLAGRAGTIVHCGARPVKNHQSDGSRLIQQNSPLLYNAVICCFLLFTIAL